MSSKYICKHVYVCRYVVLVSTMYDDVTKQFADKTKFLKYIYTFYFFVRTNKVSNSTTANINTNHKNDIMEILI